MRRNRTPRTAPRFVSGGFMILEVLIALLIFSLGVLGLIGLQANAAKQSGQAKYRTDAILLANELVGDMWAGDHSSAGLQLTYSSATPGATYSAWLTKVQATLPGVATYPPSVTLVQVNPLTPIVPTGAATPLTPTPSTQVTIEIQWKLPSDPTGDSPHNIVVVTQIK